VVVGAAGTLFQSVTLRTHPADQCFSVEDSS